MPRRNRCVENRCLENRCVENRRLENRCLETRCDERIDATRAQRARSDEKVARVSRRICILPQF